jgi:hypothetical protein
MIKNVSEQSNSHSARSEPDKPVNVTPSEEQTVCVVSVLCVRMFSARGEFLK